MLSAPTVWLFSVAADINCNVFLFLLPYLESVQTVVLCRFWLQCSRGLIHEKLLTYKCNGVIKKLFTLKCNNIIKTLVPLTRNYEETILRTHSVINKGRETYNTQESPLVKSILRL